MPWRTELRALLSDYFERLGRFDGIVELYASAPIDDDPRGLRNLGVAYLRLGRAELLDTLLPPIGTDEDRCLEMGLVVACAEPELESLAEPTRVRGIGR